MPQETGVSNAVVGPTTAARILLGAHLTLGASAAIYGYAAYGGSIPMRPPHIVLKPILFGVFLGQAISIGLWSGFSKHSRRHRFGRGLLAAGLIWTLAVTSAHSWTNVGAFVAFLIAVVVPGAATALSATGLRRYGISCEESQSCPGGVRTEGIQFSLSQLASLVAICAAVLALARVLRATGGAVSLISIISLLVVFAIIFTAQALVCLWATLGAGRWVRRIWLPWLLPLGWAPLMAFTFGGKPVDYMQFAVIAVVCVSLVLESLLVVRFAGYRIVRDVGANPTSYNRPEAEIA